MRQVGLKEVGIAVIVAGAIISAAIQILGVLDAPPWVFITLYTASGFGVIASFLVGHTTDHQKSQKAWEEKVASLTLVTSTHPLKLPKVAHSDPYSFGVSASKYVKDDFAPPYIPRDIDRDLDDAIAAHSFVLLIGKSKAGKSRTAFEAVRRLFPSHTLLAPRPGPDALRVLHDLAASDTLDVWPCVLWLDDLDRFLSESFGLDSYLLDDLASGSRRIPIVATITSLRRDQALGTEGEAGRTARFILGRARSIYLKRELSDKEREAAEQFYPDEDFTRGIGEPLVAAPVLEQKYVDGEEASPAGWAIVQAAIDWRRTGIPTFIPEPQLRKLYLTYLPKGAITLVPEDERFIQGLKWALEPVASHISLLEVAEEHPTRTFRAFDYIVAYVDGQGAESPRPIPSSAWEFVIACGTPSDLLDVAFTADSRGEPEVAAATWKKVAATDDPDSAPIAAMMLGIHLTEHGDREGAQAAFEQAIASDHHIAGPLASLSLGVELARQGYPEQARPLYEKAIASGHPAVMAPANFDLGLLLERQGLDEEAMVAYRNVIEFLSTHEPDPDNPDLLYIANGHIGNLYAKSGDLVKAKEYLEKAIEAGDPDIVAKATTNLGRHAQESGDYEKAKSLFEKVIAGGSEDASRARISLARILKEEGDVQRAKDLFRDARSSDDPHDRALAAWDLGQIMEEEENYREAKRLYQQSIEASIVAGDDTWTQVASFSLEMLMDKYELQASVEELLDHFTRFTDQEPELLITLGESLIREGSVAAARVVLTRAVDSNDEDVAQRARDLLESLTGDA